MFVSWLARSLSPASVDVYLAAVRSFHVDWGYSDPTQNKPRLRRVLQGIHRSHGAAAPPRRPITRDILCSIHRILSPPQSGFDSIMFWSACSLAFFGFLQVSEFTTCPPFNPARHFAPADVFAWRTFSGTPASHQVFQNRSCWCWSFSLHRCYWYSFMPSPGSSLLPRPSWFYCRPAVRSGRP